MLCVFAQAEGASGASVNKYLDMTCLFATAISPGDGSIACYPCTLSAALRRYYAELRSLQPPDSGEAEVENMVVMQRVVQWMGQDGLTLELVQLLLPFGVALPLQRCLAVCKVAPPDHWNPALLRLVGRADVLSLKRGREQKVSLEEEEMNFYVSSLCAKWAGHDTPSLALLWRPRLCWSRVKFKYCVCWYFLGISGAGCGRGGSVRRQRTGARERSGWSQGGETTFFECTWTENLRLARWLQVVRHSRLRFSRDLRVKEVARLLRSSRAMRLRMSAEASEADFERSKQVRTDVLVRV